MYTRATCYLSPYCGDTYPGTTVVMTVSNKETPTVGSYPAAARDLYVCKQHTRLF